MLPETHLLILEKLLNRLNSEEMIWALTGSASFALRGIDIEVNDIDLQTDKLGAYQIEQCFSDHIFQPVTFSSSDRIRSHFGVLLINGVRVEIMGDLQKRLPNGEWEPPVDVQSLREFLVVGNLRAPVLPLAHEYHAYRLLWREEKASVLERALRRQVEEVDVDQFQKRQSYPLHRAFPSVKKYLTLILALIIITIVHEGLHAMIASVYGEYAGFRVKPYGFEVIYNTPVEERAGLNWGFISGASNLATLLLGYLLFAFKNRFVKHQNNFIRSLSYWLIICLLLLDSLNLSIGSFFYGGDANGMAVGFGINLWVIQGTFMMVFFINRELLAQKVIPSFGVKTSHPLFRPWMTHI